MLRRILTICFFVLPGVAQAQPADSLLRVLSRFNTGSAIQLNESRGHFFGVKNGTVTFEGRGNVRGVPFSEINEVWKQKSHIKGGMLAGAIIGGVPTALFGVLLVGAVCENSDTHCRGDYPLAAGYGFIIGGTAGGLVGGLIGYAVKKWERVY